MKGNYIRIKFSSSGLLDFLREVFFKKSESGEVLKVDTITLNFSMELDFTDCSLGFVEISFLKKHHVNNSNSWFLAVLNEFSEDLLLFKLICVFN